MTVGGTRNAHGCIYFRTTRAFAHLAADRALGSGRRSDGGPRIVQIAHEMDDRDLTARGSQSCPDLQDASGVRAHDDVRPRGEDRGDLRALKLVRDLRMRDVVDTRAAAAPLRIGDREVNVR